MDDRELEGWGYYGRRVTSGSGLLNPYTGLGMDVVYLWQVVGELTDRVMKLEKGEE